MPPPIDEISRIADQAMQAALHELETGRPEQADALYRAVLDLLPGHGAAHYGLGMLALGAGKAGTAIPHFAHALQAAPEQEDYWLAYLEALMEARQFATARELIELGRSQGLQGPQVDAFERQLAQHGEPPVHEIEAATMLYAQRKPGAEHKAKTLTERYPQHPFGWKLLGGVLYRQRAYADALDAMRKAAAYGPDDAETLCNLGLMLRGAGLLDEARHTLDRSIALAPDSINAHNYLAATLQEMGRPAEAYDSVRQALALDPEHPVAVSSLAVILDNLGRADEAIEAYRRALVHEPDNFNVYGNMLFCMSHMERFTAQELFDEHVRFGERLAARAAPATAWRNDPDPARALQVGFVSGDLRNHAVASFLEPMFRELGKRPGLVLHVYYTHPLHDDVTATMRGHVAHWHDIDTLDDVALDARIRADGIDILVDLSGHTAYNRLPVFARKPAPVQASWLGYPGTTGLAAIDYYLYDRFLLPPGAYDHLFTEALVRLPAGSAFSGPADAPDVSALPALANGHLTFGSFNRLSKISRAVVALWGKLLRALPDARLLVGGMPSGDSAHAQLEAWLNEEGIASSRLSFHPRSATRDYLAMHAQVDICLDTFPYTGGTTTLFALFMGVPTLTLASASIAGRQTSALLSHHGLQGFIAADADDFVAKGVAASRDLAALAQVRAGLRGSSPLWTPEGVTRIVDALESALRRMWERWCAGLPAVGFEVPADAAHDAPDGSAPAPSP